MTIGESASTSAWHVPMTGELLAIGTRPAVTIASDAPVAEVARLMRQHKIGFVIVVDGTDHVVGVLTDRDLVLGVLACDLPGGTTSANRVMSREVAWIREDRTAMDAARQMVLHGCRRLPVVSEEGRVLGVVTLDDIQRSEAVLAQQMERLLSGKGAAELASPRTKRSRSTQPVGDTPSDDRPWRPG